MNRQRKVSIKKAFGLKNKIYKNKALNLQFFTNIRPFDYNSFSLVSRLCLGHGNTKIY